MFLKRNMKKIILIIIVLSLGSVLLAGCQLLEECKECPACEVCDICPDIPEYKSPIYLRYDNMYYTETPDEYVFNFYLFNFGNLEIKDLVIDCYIFYANDTLIASFEEKTDNLASQTMNTREISVYYHLEIINNVGSSCFIKNCSDCNIIIDNIPSLFKLKEARRKEVK